MVHLTHTHLCLYHSWKTPLNYFFTHFRDVFYVLLDQIFYYDIDRIRLASLQSRNVRLRRQFFGYGLPPWLG